MPKFLERITAQTFASAASTALDIFVSGDSNARIAVDAGGKLTWGSGSGAGDVTLYRSAANALKTDDTFEGAAGLITLTTSGKPTGALADGAIAVDTTNTVACCGVSPIYNKADVGISGECCPYS